MPTVPTRPTQTVRPEPVKLPMQKPSSFSAPFGLANARAQQQITKAMWGLGDTLLHIKGQRDQRAAEDAATHLNRQVQDLLYGTPDDPSNPGFLMMKGEHAVNQAADMRQYIDDLHASISGSLKSEQSRALFAKLSESTIQTADRQMATHVSQQNEVAQDKANEAYRATLSDAAIGDPYDHDARVQALIAILDTTKAEAAHKGLPEKASEQLLMKRMGYLHTGTIDNLIALQKYDDAEQYFNEYKDAIPGPLHAQILNDLRRARGKDLAILRDKVKDHIDVFSMGNVPTGWMDTRNKIDAIGGDQAVILKKRLDEAAANQPVIRAFNRSSIAQQTAEVFSEKAGAHTGQEARRYELMRKNLTANVSAISHGYGLQLAEQHGIIHPLSPMDYSAQAFRERKDAAERATATYGQYIGPLDEPGAHKSLVDLMRGKTVGDKKLTPDETVSVMRNMVAGLGEADTRKVAQDIAAKGDAPEMAVAVTRSIDRPEVARSIIEGGRLMRDNKELIPKVIDRLPQQAKNFGNMFTKDTAVAMHPYVNAAEALYVQKIVESGKNLDTFQRDLWDQSVKEVTGGILDHEGRKILAPIYGLSQDQFDNLTEHLTPEMFKEFSSRGGAPVYDDGKPFNFTDGYTFLSSSADGRYLVQGPDHRFVQQDTGGAYEFNMRKAIESGVLTIPARKPQGPRAAFRVRFPRAHSIAPGAEATDTWKGSK